MTEQASTTDVIATKLDHLKQSSYADLIQEWQRLYRSRPPKQIGRDLLILGIAWKIQEQAHGGHRPTSKRLLADLARKVEQDGDVIRDRIISPKPGAKLVREWKGEIHTVTVLQDAFEWQGKQWASLSVIAREITGTRWSGPRFFALREPSGSRPSSGNRRHA